MPNETPETTETTAWALASGKKRLALKELKRLIPSYDYSSKGDAGMTNDRFCKFMLEKLRRSKAVLFNIINTCYELHIDNDLKDFNKIRDELDIFLDEIKVLYIEWNEKTSQKWLEKIISHDLNLIKDSRKLAENLEAVFKEIIRAKKRDDKFWKQVSKKATFIEEQLDGMVRMFKEREALCKLKPLSLEKVFKSARKEISEKT